MMGYSTISGVEILLIVANWYLNYLIVGSRCTSFTCIPVVVHPLASSTPWYYGIMVTTLVRLWLTYVAILFLVLSVCVDGVLPSILHAYR